MRGTARSRGDTKAPEGTGGTPAVQRVLGLQQAAVPGRRRVPRSLALRLSNPVPGTAPWIAPRLRSGGSLLPLRARPMYGPGPKNHNGLIHELAGEPSTLSPKLWTLWTGCGYSSGRCRDPWPICSRGSSAINDRWARPFGDFNHRWLSALFGPIRPIKDLLNGALAGPSAPCGDDGHPDRPAPRRGHPRPGRPAGGRRHRARRDDPLHAPLGRVGLADYTDTDGTARTRATTHATLMVVALVVLLVSLVMRAGAPGRPDGPVVLGIVAFRLVSAGAFVGGDVVYSSATWSAATRSAGPARSGSGSTRATRPTSTTSPRRRPRR